MSLLGSKKPLQKGGEHNPKLLDRVSSGAAPPASASPDSLMKPGQDIPEFTEMHRDRSALGPNSKVKHLQHSGWVSISPAFPKSLFVAFSAFHHASAEVQQ